MGFSDPAIINPGSVTNTEISASAAIDPDKFDQTKFIGTNWLHFMDLNNCTDSAPANTTLTRSLPNGTIELSVQNANATITTRQTELLAPVARAQVLVFRFASLSGIDNKTFVQIGFQDSGFNHQASIYWDQTNWNTMTHAVGTTTNIISAPVAGDVFVIYLTNGRASFFKNNVHLFTHTTNLPTNAVGYSFYIAATIASPDITLDKVSIE